MNKVWRQFALVSHLGLSTVTPILICALIGRWFSENFSEGFFILFLIIGVITGFRNFYVVVTRFLKDGQDHDE